VLRHAFLLASQEPKRLKQFIVSDCYIISSNALGQYR
jgi:hypothetical protein